jgi:hypothetical protein
MEMQTFKISKAMGRRREMDEGVQEGKIARGKTAEGRNRDQEKDDKK